MLQNEEIEQTTRFPKLRGDDLQSIVLCPKPGPKEGKGAR